MQRDSISQHSITNTAVVITAGALALYGLRRTINYLSGTEDETSTIGYSAPRALTALWGLSELDVLSASSTLWMVDQNVLHRDIMTKDHSIERRQMIKDINYDMVLWIRPGSCYSGEATISFHWNPKSFINPLNDDSQADYGETSINRCCFLNFSGGVIERIWVNRTSIGRDGRPDISGPFQLLKRRQLGTVTWKAHRINIDHQLLQPNAVNEIVIRYFSEYDRATYGLCQLAEQGQYGGTGDALEEYVFSACDGFEAHRIFPCFDQPDMKAQWRIRFAAPPQNLVVCIGLNPNCVSSRRSSLSRSVFEDDFQWYQTVNAICHGKFLEDQLWTIGDRRKGLPIKAEASVKDLDEISTDMLTNEALKRVTSSSLGTALGKENASSRLSTHTDLPPHFIDMLGFPSSHPSRMLCRLLMLRGQAAVTGGGASLSSLWLVARRKEGADISYGGRRYQHRHHCHLHRHQSKNVQNIESKQDGRLLTMARSYRSIPSLDERIHPESGFFQSIPRTHNRIVEFVTESPAAPCDVAFSIGPFHFVERLIPHNSGSQRLLVTLFYRRGAKKTFNQDIIFSIVSFGLDHFERYLDQVYPFSKLDLVYLPETSFTGVARRDPFLSHGRGVIVIPESALYFTEGAPTEIVVMGAVGLLQFIVLCWLSRNITFAWWEEVWWSRSLALYLVFDAIKTTQLSELLSSIILPFPSAHHFHHHSSTTLILNDTNIAETISLIFHSTVKRKAYSDDSNMFISQPPCCSVQSTNQLMPIAQLSRKKGAGILRQMEALIGQDIIRQCVISFISNTEIVRVKNFFSLIAGAAAAASRPLESSSKIFTHLFALNEISSELANDNGCQLLNHTLWIPSWLGRSGVNTLHAVWAVGSSGLISTFEIRQFVQLRSSQSHRPRRVRIDLIIPSRNKCFHKPEIDNIGTPTKTEGERQTEVAQQQSRNQHGRTIHREDQGTYCSDTNHDDDITTYSTNHHENKTQEGIKCYPESNKHNRSEVPEHNPNETDHRNWFRAHPSSSSFCSTPSYRVESQSPYQIESYFVDLINPITMIPQFVGLCGPLAVLINADDNDYCRVWLDSATLLFVESQLSSLNSSLMRLVVWSSLWDTMEDSELCSLRFLEIFEKQALLEDNPLVLSQAILFISNTLRLYLPDEHLVNGCYRIRNAAIKGEKRHNKSPEMRALWQWLLATVSIEPSSVAALLERMDHEDSNAFTTGRIAVSTDFRWGIQSGYWKKDKPSKIKHNQNELFGTVELLLNQDVRWMIIENLWALEVPLNQPERDWWVREREKRLASEMDRDSDALRVQNAALKCYSANPEETTMEECWNRFMAVSSITYKEVIPLMNSFNRRRLPLMQNDVYDRPWWSFSGFYRNVSVKKVVQDEWTTRILNIKLHQYHQEPCGVTSQHHPHSLDGKKGDQTNSNTSPLSIYSGSSTLAATVFAKFDQRFVCDVNSLFFKIDPLLAKNVWQALCPIHRPTTFLREALEKALNACASMSKSRESQELRRSIGASLQTIDRICESRGRCLVSS